MTFEIENESDLTITFDYEKMANEVINKVLDFEQCPYEVELDLLLTTDEEIKKYNGEFRDIHRSTDVLSFPLIEYSQPSDFSIAENSVEDSFNPETGELLLGNIILSVPTMFVQAKEYGHSQEREFAFLLVHSMLHLLGYDHIEDSDRILMEEKQKKILAELNILRD